jgi:hypothetical protein
MTSAINGAPERFTIAAIAVWLDRRPKRSGQRLPLRTRTSTATRSQQKRFLKCPAKWFDDRDKAFKNSTIETIYRTRQLLSFQLWTCYFV